MAVGKNRQRLINGDKQVNYETATTWDFLYRTSTTKDPEYNIGDTVRLPDRREFVYAKSSGACTTNVGCHFTYTGAVAYTAFATSHAVGSYEITIPAATHDAFTKDELRGGYVLIFDGASTSYVQLRGITGNAATAADVAFTVTLDAKLTDAVVAGTEAVEVYRNSFAGLATSSSTTLPFAGIPATGVSAASMYFWVQVQGVCWSSPQSGVGGTNGQQGVFWRHDGSVEKADTALATTVPAYSSSQYAGYLVQGTAAGNGPLLHLTG